MRCLSIWARSIRSGAARSRSRLRRRANGCRGSSIPSSSIARRRARVSPAPWWRGGRARSGSTGRNCPRLPAAPLGALGLTPFAAGNARVAGLTGDRDIVADATRMVTIANGDPLMSKVTAMGCAASALVGACLAGEADAWNATAAALILIGVAGELAAGRAQGPGTFAAGILDALHGLDQAAIVERARAES